MKYFRTFIIICCIGLIYSSCVKKANYPNVPVISYNNFYCDSACLRLNFTDGNGDIGYPSQQQDVSPDLFAIPLIYYKKTKTYAPLPAGVGLDTVITFSYNIPDITPTGSDKELSGIIQINFENSIKTYVDELFIQDTSLLDSINPYTLEFKVWVIDRAGNKSNVLITPPQNYPCQ